MGAICCGSGPGAPNPGDKAEGGPSLPSAGGLLVVQAATAGNAQQLKSLLQSGGSADQSFAGRGAVIHAIEARHGACVRLLVEAGANLDYRSWCGETPLIMACNAGDAVSAAALLRAGAELEETDNTGRRAVIAAAESNDACGAVECLELLLAARANLEAANNNGDNALLRAAMMGHLSSAAYLVESRANTEATDCSGKTALMIASAREKVDVERFLTPMLLTLQVFEEAGEDGLTPVMFTNMAGEEVASLRADFARPVSEMRAALRMQLVNQAIQIMSTDGHFLATPEDELLLGDVIGCVAGDVGADDYLV